MEQQISLVRVADALRASLAVVGLSRAAVCSADDLGAVILVDRRGGPPAVAVAGVSVRPLLALPEQEACWVLTLDEDVPVRLLIEHDILAYDGPYYDADVAAEQAVRLLVDSRFSRAGSE